MSDRPTPLTLSPFGLVILGTTAGRAQRLLNTIEADPVSLFCSGVKELVQGFQHLAEGILQVKSA